MSTTLIGTLLSKRIFGEWAIGDFRSEKGVVRVVGECLLDLTQGETYRLAGQLSVHPKHGERFVVESFEPEIPAQVEALQRYLVQNFEGVGAKGAQQIIRHFQDNATLEELRLTLIEAPWTLASMDLALPRSIKYKVDGEEAELNHLVRLLTLRHAGIGVPKAVLRRLAQWLLEQPTQKGPKVPQALQRFDKDPYQPIAHVWGYGFQFADAIATASGIGRDSPLRMAAITYNVLRAAVDQEGHCFLPSYELLERVQAIEPAVHLDPIEQYAKQRGYPIVRDENDHFYLEHMRTIEDGVAAYLFEMLQPSRPIRPFANRDSLMAETHVVEKRIQTSSPLDQVQRSAVVDMLYSQVRLHTLTAPPGCGKTKLLEILAQMVLGSVAFCTPTGKAAKVLNARIAAYKLTATTIHQLLEPSLEGFQRNADNPILADVIVVDEASMVDLPLFHSLLCALKPGAHLILVGDRNQLLSVGPGSVLANMLKLAADHHSLKTPYRNSGSILALTRQIEAGRFDPSSAQEPDFELVENLEDGEADLDRVCRAYIDAVSRVGITNTVLLVPIRKGSIEKPGWNTTYFNFRLQRAINATGARIPGTPFAEGDRVIIRRTMVLQGDSGAAAIQLVNGDTGTVANIEFAENQTVRRFFIRLDDGRRVPITVDLVDQISLAYAMTVHASQGSEFQEVIIAMKGSASGFLNRPVLYTSVSRAKCRLTVFGARENLNRIAARQGSSRYSALVRKVETYLPTPDLS